MKKTVFNKRTPLHFKQFQRKGYSLFACLGREVLIGTLSVATLTYAKADGISTEPQRPDTLSSQREVKLEEVCVTGSRAPLTRSQQARMVTVLDRADIQAAPVQSINDLLKMAVGVDVRQRGPIGAQTDISVRGGNYEQITILLNGISICDPQTGHNAFDFPVDICDIERIEVLEGPAGRVYGTSSLLGAINIVTRNSSSSLQAHAEGGSYGYASVGGRVALASAVSNSLSAGFTRSDGYSRNSKGHLNADYQGWRAFYQGHYDDETFAVNWHAGVSCRDFGSNTFYGAKWDDQFEHTLKTFTALQAENKHGRLHIKPSVYWNRNHDRFELFRGNAEAYPFNYHRTDVFGANLNSYCDWLLGRTAFGAELRNEDLISGNLGEPLNKKRSISGTSRQYEYGLNRTNVSFMLEHNILLERFTLSAGLVAVKNSWNEMNMRVYPGADASYRIGEHWKIYASYNTSLRLPSVTELYYSVGGHQADKHLKPEELSAVEAGLKAQYPGVMASVSVYHNHCKNIIDWIRDTTKGPDAPWQSVNFTKVNATGCEVNTNFNLALLMPGQSLLKQLDVAYSYISQDKMEKEGIQSQFTLEYLRHKFVAKLGMNVWKNLNMSIHYRLQDRTGSYTDSQGQVKDYEPYSVVDARLSYDMPRYSFYAEANNLLNKTYVDFGHIPQPGIWIMAGASLNINL